MMSIDMNDAPSSQRAFVFAGGGTGGHIYPALAIIKALRAIQPSVDVHILCSNRAIDTEILNAHDVPFSVIPAMPISTKIGGFLKFIKGWGPSVHSTRACIKRLKADNDEVVLIAMGGFVAAPGAKGGRAESAKVVLVNLDAVPGKANVLIAKNANKIYTAATITSKDPKFNAWEQVRPIVRNNQGMIDQAVARQSFNLDPDTKTLLITGGSQGATSINGFVRSMVDQQPDAFIDWQIIHQVGNKMSDEQLDQLRSVYQSAAISAFVERYIDDMAQALGAADLAIGRCGAGSVAECWDAALPSLFFPYPYHQDEHQKHNAQVLVDAGTAMLFADQIDPEINYQSHHQEIAAMLKSDQRLIAMKQGYESLPAPDGAKVIAQALLSN
mgnify:FL=1